MKSFQAQTHYEVLEISVGASLTEVKTAHERLSQLYSDDQVVLYGLIDPARAAALRTRLKEALEVLSDEERREAYDVKIGLPPRNPPRPAAPPKAAVASAAVAATGWGSFTYATAQVAAPQVASQSSSYTWTVRGDRSAAPGQVPQTFAPASAPPADDDVGPPLVAASSLPVVVFAAPASSQPALAPFGSALPPTSAPLAAAAQARVPIVVFAATGGSQAAPAPFGSVLAPTTSSVEPTPTNGSLAASASPNSPATTPASPPAATASAPTAAASAAPTSAAATSVAAASAPASDALTSGATGSPAPATGSPPPASASPAAASASPATASASPAIAFASPATAAPASESAAPASALSRGLPLASGPPLRQSGEVAPREGGSERASSQLDLGVLAGSAANWGVRQVVEQPSRPDEPAAVAPPPETTSTTAPEAPAPAETISSSAPVSPAPEPQPAPGETMSSTAPVSSAPTPLASTPESAPAFAEPPAPTAVDLITTTMTPPPATTAPMPVPEPEVPRLSDESVETAIVPARASPAREFKVETRPKPYEVPSDVEFNGDLLRQVRMARGLSLSQLAERTRIGSKHLENVEADRYDALPAVVYLRGILMNLARELGLDGIRVSKSYLAFVEAHRSKG